jgi:hypothetical protein
MAPNLGNVSKRLQGYAAFRDGAGGESVGSLEGPGDLSTNGKHMAGYGR